MNHQLKVGMYVRIPLDLDCGDLGFRDFCIGRVAEIDDISEIVTVHMIDLVLGEAINAVRKCPIECVSRARILPDTKLLPPNSTAKDLAGLIHQDIAKGFLHAIDCKTKQRISGDQQLKNDNVIKIVSTLSRG